MRVLQGSNDCDYEIANIRIALLKVYLISLYDSEREPRV